MKNEIIAGLDLGSTKTVCMIAKMKENAAPELEGIGISKTKGFKNGIVTSIDEATESIILAVSEAEREANVKLTGAFVGITGSHIKGESSKGMISVTRAPTREITEEDVSQIIDQAASVKIPADREIIQKISQSFTVDDHIGIKNPVGLDGNRLEGNIYIITGAESVVQNICKVVNRAGLEVKEIILQSLASSYSVLDQDEKELSCAVIDVGGGTTDCVIFNEGQIKDVFTVALGGIDITNDISIGLAITRADAETIKTTNGVARSELAGNEVVKVQKFNRSGEQLVEKRAIASIIAPRVEEILGLVNRKLRYTNSETLPSAVVLTGGAAKMVGIDGLAERIFGIPVRIGSPNTIEVSTEEEREKIRVPSYASAIGLLIYGMMNQDTNHKKKGSNKYKGMGTRESKPWILKLGNKMGDWLLK
ncbi:MAG: cell division protein FtsA [Candidatus Stahlbacteria bacterium]|nr:cell division protein FtsA [Candidatus Stahlbacteria bacterium]